MNRTIRQYHAIIYIVLFYLLMAVLLLFPCGILKKDRTVAGSENIVKTAEVRLDQQVQQVFVADGDYLRYLELYVSNPDPDWNAAKRYHISVYDESNEKLFDREIAIQADELPGFLRVPLGIKTTPGTAYVWQIQGVNRPMELAIENTGETGLTVFGNYYDIYNGKTTMHEGQNVVMRLIYTDSPSMRKMAALCILLFAAAAGVITAARVLIRKKNPDKRVKLQTVVQLTLGPVFFCAIFYLLYTVYVQELFGGNAEDKRVYGLGIGIAAVYFLWVLLTKRTSKEEPPFRSLIEEKGMDWLQSAVFAGVLLGCIRFMNAQFQIYQDLAYREVLVWSGLLLLTMSVGKELFRKKNAVCLLISGSVGTVCYFLYKTHLPEGKTVLDAKLIRNDILVAAVFSLVFLILIDKFRAKAFAFGKLNRLYTGLLLALFAFLLIFRNTRGWPVYLIFIFSLFYLFYLGWENRDRLLVNFSNGIILNFALAVIFCLARRPYRAWVCSRYNFVFHTVTVTATYLTLVVCALTVRLLYKLYKKCSFAQMWGTLLLYGLSVSFLFMTLSRTGYLAAIAMTVVIVPFAVFFCYRQRVRAFLKAILCMALAGLLCLPVAYSGIRLLPALYNDPYIYEVEESFAAIHKDDRKDSNAYMSVSYFEYVMKNKLFPDLAEAEEWKKILTADRSTVTVMPGTVFLASGEEDALSGLDEFSNGRLDIFGSYIDHWNLTGHDEMGVLLPDGSVSVHAHNTFLQVIHDHGLITGAVYLLFGIISALLLFVYAMQKGKKAPAAVLPLAVLIGFTVAGMVEWLFHPCNPFGFSVMVIIAPLLCFKSSRKQDSLKENDLLK